MLENVKSVKALLLYLCGGNESSEVDCISFILSNTFIFQNCIRDMEHLFLTENAVHCSS